MNISHPRLLDKVRAVLFDLDGTLLDTAPDLVNALRKICSEENVPPPEYDLAARYVSTGAIGLIRLAFPDHTDADQKFLCQRLVDAYTSNICVHTRPYPGMVEVLTYLDAEKLPWGIVTNKLERLAIPILEALNLRKNCRIIVGGDTATKNKPHPDPINHALKQLGLAPECVVYVGDHQKDVAAGRAAGTLTVAVTWGYIIPGEDPYKWNADYTINHPDELLNLTIR
jgi:phosphoglycolate phosphatase